MSHLIRNILEDTFDLVDDVVGGVDEIVSDSVELARRVGRDARRMAGAVRDAVATDAVREADAPVDLAADGADEGPLADVYAWNGVIANRAVACAHCHAPIERGAQAFVGLSDDATRARTWLCPACREAL